MRRLTLALAVVFGLTAQLTTAALAAGPGGWDHVGHGATAAMPALNGAVYALNSDKPGVIYAGGAFTNAGGHADADYLAVWRYDNWGAVNGAVTLNGAVDAIAYDHGTGKVYVGGQFTDVGGNVNLDYLAEWDGSSWKSPCAPTLSTRAVTAQVAALQIIGNTLYIGGSFGNGAGIASADYLLACDLTTGATRSTVLHDGGFNAGIYALTADGNGTLYAGGLFTNVDGIQEADHVAYYSGGLWHAMGSGPGPTFAAVPAIVRSLAAHGTSVYVGTDATDIAGIPQADHIAKWNAQTLSYSAMGSNTAGTNGWFDSYAFLYGMTTYSNLVFVTGSFQNANGVAAADEIAYFDGHAWHPLGSNGAGQGPLNAAGAAVATYFGNLYASGGQNIGGDARADYLGSHFLVRPDAGIGLHRAGPFVGSNVYGYDGAGETKTISIHRGHHGVLYYDIKNNGLAVETFFVGQVQLPQGLKVTWFHGTTDVTAQVQSIFATGNLVPGGHLTLKVVIKVTARHASHIPFFIAGTATGLPSGGGDRIKVIVNAT